MSWVFCVFCGSTIHNTTVPSDNNLHLLTDEQWCEEELEEAELIWKCYYCKSYLIGDEWYASETKVKEIAPLWKPAIKAPCSRCGSNKHSYCSNKRP